MPRRLHGQLRHLEPLVHAVACTAVSAVLLMSAAAEASAPAGEQRAAIDAAPGSLLVTYQRENP